ncbi:efflux RND transporter periplasmic adaptor subunit, partial [Candidatus Latescibacterota bacterium]
KKGSVLLETDDVLFKTTADIARANLEYQEKEFARNEKLLREGSITEAMYDISKLTLAQTRGAFEQATKQYEDATLTAPFSGLVTMRNVEVGDILAPGSPAFRIIDVRKVKVQTGIPEKYIGDFKIGNNVDLTFDAVPGVSFKGTINYVSPEASPSVRTFLGEIIVDNSAGLLRAGIMGDAHIMRKVYDNARMVPLNALIDTQEGRVLYLVRSDNTAEQRSVDIGSISATEVMITSGISPGDQVIVKGQHDLVDGERINITGEYSPMTGEGVQ